MLRIPAVRSLLVEEVAGVRPSVKDDSEDPLAAIRSARIRAVAVAALDWAAIVTLFLLRDQATDFLGVGAGEQTLFTFGVLALATHAGFRLGQMEKYRAVERALEELPDDFPAC